ncbi:MAG: metallophosphoesterase [Clostridia bacterium]|nr:metallophosphoesterase [Clostridia bacterium]
MLDVTKDARFRIDRDTLVIDGLQRSYRLFQLSDSHMSPDSPLDTDEHREKAAHLREVWMQHGNGLSQEDNFRALTAYGRSLQCDRFLFAGDMTDFPSPGTASVAKTMFDEAGAYLYTPGNHEQAFRFPSYFEAIANGDPAFQVTELEELRLVAVDNAAHGVPDRVIEALTDVLYGDKPVILLQHTPLDCPTLRPFAEDYWQDVTYFLFGLPGEGDNIDTYVRLLTKEKTQLKAVVAGHLHLSHVDTFENGVTQFVSAPCLAGYARVIDIQGR